MIDATREARFTASATGIPGDSKKSPPRMPRRASSEHWALAGSDLRRSPPCGRVYADAAALAGMVKPAGPQPPTIGAKFTGPLKAGLPAAIL